jgi:membrane protein YqaA with SNARE-associated domain
MIDRLVRWVENWAGHHHATKALALVAFVESSFFPIPPFVLMVVMLAQDKKPSWVRIAIIGSLSSVMGGIFGYFIGKFFYAFIGAPLVAFYGIGAEIAQLGVLFQEHVFWTIIIASLSPMPYKVFTLSAGLFSVDLTTFIIASIVGRGIRFLAVSYVANKYGLHAKRFITEQKRTTTIAFMVAVVACIVYAILRTQGIL